MNREPLTTQALLGAARMAALPQPPAPEMEGLWPGLDPGNPADSLLRALALGRALRMAGARAITLDEEAPVPCPEESRPRMSAPLLAAGMRLLDGDFAELTAEWLGVCAEAGVVAPPGLLPALLPFATRHHAHREMARRICGERGVWLARRHPEFAWLLEHAVAADSAWDDGQPAERVAWLRHMRASDPDRARAAVFAQWAGEDPAMRERIMRVIAEAPSPEDVPFLEAEGIKDRRQEVREPALGALLRIPGSPLRQRAVQRLRPLIAIERKLFRRRITVHPPSAFDPAWAADGIREKPPQGTGEKAWWLRQLVAMVPFDAWREWLEIPSAEMLDLPVDGDWADPLRLGWMDAARRAPEATPLREFIPWVVSLSPWPNGGTPAAQLVIHLLDELPATERYIILESIHDRCEPALTLDLMARCNAAAPAGIAPRCFATLRKTLRQSPSPLTRPQARALARCLPAGEIDREIQSLAALADLTSAAEEFATTLEFRRLIHQPATS